MKWRKPKALLPRPGAPLLKEFLDPTHPLFRLAGVLNWTQFEHQFGKFYADRLGRPALAIRLLVGLHYLKHLYNVSDEVNMAAVANEQSVIIRTERGLSIAGTRITLYDIMEYLLAGWPPEAIRHRLDLTEQQMTDAVAYIDTHRAEVEAEYQTVLQNAREIQRYWEEQNRERLTHSASQPPKPEQEVLRKKLHEWKAKIESRNDLSR